MVLFSVTAQAYGATDIGIILRLEDKYNTFPRQMVEGMNFALKRLDKQKKINFITVSHNGSPVSIKRAVGKLVKANVKIIVGGETSSDAIQISKFTSNKNIIYVTPTASSRKVNLFNNNSFRMMLSEEKMPAFVNEVVTEEKCQKVGVFHNISKPNTDSISTIVSENLVKTTPISVKVLSDEKNIDSKLMMFLENKVDCLVLFAFESDLRKVYSFFKKKKFFPTLIGGDGWGTNEKVFKDYGKGKFKAYRAMYWNSERIDPFYLNLRDSYNKEHTRPLNEFSAVAFDTIKVIYEALELNNFKIDEGLKQILVSRKFDNLLTAETLSFDSDASPIKDINTYIIDNKSARFWKGINP